MRVAVLIRSNRGLTTFKWHLQEFKFGRIVRCCLQNRSLRFKVLNQVKYYKLYKL